MRKNGGIESKRKKILYVLFRLKDRFIVILEDKKVSFIFWRNSSVRSNIMLNSFESFKHYDLSLSLANEYLITQCGLSWLDF
jgi:hypothetical protein